MELTQLEEFMFNCVDFMADIPLFMFVPILYGCFLLMECLHEYIYGNQYKRKHTYSGNLTPREYYLIDSLVKECEKELTDENLKMLGMNVLCFANSEKKNKEDIKTFFNKFKFWKRG